MASVFYKTCVKPTINWWDLHPIRKIILLQLWHVNTHCLVISCYTSLYTVLYSLLWLPTSFSFLFFAVLAGHTGNGAIGTTHTQSHPTGAREWSSTRHTEVTDRQTDKLTHSILMHLYSFVHPALCIWHSKIPRRHSNLSRQQLKWTPVVSKHLSCWLQ